MVKDNQRNKYLKAAEIKYTREGQLFYGRVILAVC